METGENTPNTCWDINVLANKENIWSFLCGRVVFSLTPLYNCKKDSVTIFVSESETAKGNSGWADFSTFQSGHSQDQQKTLSENDTNAKAHESNSPQAAVAASAMSISVDSDQPQT